MVLEKSNIDEDAEFYTPRPTHWRRRLFVYFATLGLNDSTIWAKYFITASELQNLLVQAVQASLCAVGIANRSLNLNHRSLTLLN